MLTTDLPMTPAAMDALTAATQCYTARQARTAHPDGSFDTKQRWYPSDAEAQPCCACIRRPSARYPYALLLHCRRAQHIAALHAVTVEALRAAARTATPRKPRTVHTRYKVVRINQAATDVRMYTSLCDPSHTYAVGRTYRQAAKKDHGGGWYVHTGEHVREAFLAGDIWRTPTAGCPYAILRCEVWGRCIAYPNGKEAWTSLRPVAAVDQFTVA